MARCRLANKELLAERLLDALFDVGGVNESVFQLLSLAGL